MDQISGVGHNNNQVPKERQRNTKLFELSSNPARREEAKPIPEQADEVEGR